MAHSDDRADPPHGDLGEWSAYRNTDQTEAAAGEGAAEQAAAEQLARAQAAREEAAKDASGHSEGGESSNPAGSRPGALDLAPADLSPFFRSSEGGGGASGGAARGRFAAMVDHASSAALVVCMLGFAFAAGTYLFSGAPGSAPKSAAALAQGEAERIEMLRTAQKMADDMTALKANVEGLRAALAQAQASAPRGVEKSLDALKAKLDSARTDANGQIAELSAKVDRLQRDPALQQVAERLDRIEKQVSSTLATGSVAPLVKAATQGRTLDAQARALQSVDQGAASKTPRLITAWVVRDVYNGVALVENARGSLEVALGDTIPGAGTVRSIERRGGGWIVITNRGLVDYDHSIMQP